MQEVWHRRLGRQRKHRQGEAEEELQSSKVMSTGLKGRSRQQVVGVSQTGMIANMATQLVYGKYQGVDDEGRELPVMRNVQQGNK